MSLPNLPVFFDMKYTLPTGDLTPDAYLYNDNMFQTLDMAIFLLNSIVASTVSSNRTVTNEGLLFPQKTSAQITTLGADTTIPLGAAWFDTDIAKLKVKTAASTIETITSA